MNRLKENIEIREIQLRGNLLDFYWAKVNDNIFQEDEQQWVYLMFNPASKLYKIGITQCPYHRLKQIQYQLLNRGIVLVCAVEMEIGFDSPAYVVEEILKDFFKRKKYFGEWFTFSKKDLVMMRQLKYYLGSNEIHDPQFEEWIYTNLL